MGTFVNSRNGEFLLENFDYLVFQDGKGRLSDPVRFDGTILLTTGSGSPKERKILELIAKLDPGWAGRLYPTEPSGVSHFITFVLGMATAFGVLVVTAFVF